MPDQDAASTQGQQAPVTQPERDEATGKLVYNYQPLDSEGQPIGKPYRFLYTDYPDLVQQITKAKENGDRYIHAVETGKRSVQGEPAIAKPSYAPVEAKEESDRKRREEFKRTAEEELGAPLDSVRSTLKEAQEMREYLIANTWVAHNEDFYACPENAKKLNTYIKENNLRVSEKNLDLAFEELRDSLVQRPKAAETQPADSTQQQAQGTGATRTVPATRSTGIIPGQFQGTRPSTTTEKAPLTRERFRQIDKMSYPEFKRLERTNPSEYKAFVTMKMPKAQPTQ